MGGCERFFLQRSGGLGSVCDVRCLGFCLDCACAPHMLCTQLTREVAVRVIACLFIVRTKRCVTRWEVVEIQEVGYRYCFWFTASFLHPMRTTTTDGTQNDQVYNSASFCTSFLF